MPPKGKGEGFLFNIGTPRKTRERREETEQHPQERKTMKMAIYFQLGGPLGVGHSQGIEN